MNIEPFKKSRAVEFKAVEVTRPEQISNMNPITSTNNCFYKWMAKMTDEYFAGFVFFLAQ